MIQSGVWHHDLIATEVVQLLVVSDSFCNILKPQSNIDTNAVIGQMLQKVRKVWNFPLISLFV